MFSMMQRFFMLSKLFKVTTIIVLFSLSFMIYYKLNVRSHQWHIYLKKGDIPCEISNEDYNSLIDMAEHLARILTKYNIKYWLVYGSFVGALRYKGPIPWDTDIDLGIEWQTIKKYFPDKIIDILANEDFNAHYRSIGGMIRVTNNHSRADLMLFTDYWRTCWMNRVGI